MIQDEADLLNHIDSLWEHFIFTGHPDALASYIELGGEIDDNVRGAIVKILREGPPKKKGSRDNIRDIEVYMRIKEIKNGPLFRKVNQAEQEILGPTRTLKKAREIYIKQLSVTEPDDTVRKQYDRGKKLLGGK
jgi:hypothetical protein